MTITREEAVKLAEACTAAWNAGSSHAVAEFFAEQGAIVINGGEPWTGRAGVQKMADDFFSEVPNLFLVCDHVRSAADHVAYLWTFTRTHARTPRPWRTTAPHRTAPEAHSHRRARHRKTVSRSARRSAFARAILASRHKKSLAHRRLGRMGHRCRVEDYRVARLV